MTNAAVSGSRSPRSAQGLRRRRSLLALAIVGSAGVSAPTAGTRAAERPDATSPAAPAPARIARDGPFDANVVVDLARALAGAPYVPPPASLPEVLAKLDYDQYREIQFRPSATLWARPGHTFQLQLLPLGYIFTTPVEIALVKDGRATHLAYSADLFVAGELVPGPLPTEDIGFSGFRLLYPIDERGRHDEVAVFQGASYFRSLGRDENYGLSARGLALKIGDPTGEEFPAFRAFWIEEPSRRSATAVVHALLDSPSVTGAYRFEIRPGQSTAMLVDAVLFPRVELKQVGIAPGTSMFFFGPNDRSGVDDFRPQVHDSDGLLVVNGRGERLWRPLSNPAKLQISAFSDRSPRGFGLVQRDRNPADFQDLESHFERRPSLWVEPSGDWGEGDVVLAEIPSSAEFHDNIVAFWRPRTPIPAGVPFHLSYRLSWGDEPPVALDRLRASRTAVGRADIKGPTPVRRFVVDYSPAPARCRGRCAAPMAVVTASAGKVGDVVVHDNPLTRGYRVSFTLDPEKAELSELRLELKFEDSRCAEIWLYRWTKR
ncbi:MAG TPA: glucan biosynthesis protein G [Anaeromyxobacteraceae bacterium]|nr:glucan biosynthesis protein G [Anaeromyxobacteraceae bacterium]